MRIKVRSRGELNGKNYPSFDGNHGLGPTYSAVLGGLGRSGPLYRRIVFTIDYEGLYDEPYCS